ncbi:MAG TPA: hypothetical protein IAD30_00350, partial [Bacteroidetes bacterium]|nr:hypothetical protein [Bacteroidota bacterium]
MIDFTSLYQNVKDKFAEEDFASGLNLLRDTAHRILEGGKLPISQEDVELFLQKAYWTIERAANYHREAFWDRDLQVIAADIKMTGLKIIRKYDVQDVSVKISYVRSASSLEKDPVKVAALDKEFD